MGSLATRSRRGLAAFGAAGVLALFQLLVLGSADSAPVGVVLTTAGFGLVTLIGVAAAWRGIRAGLVTAIVARVVDSALGIPAFFLDAPAWILALITAMLVLTIAGIALLVPDLRRGRAGTVRS
jgi:hypothetical protein